MYTENVSVGQLTASFIGKLAASRLVAPNLNSGHNKSPNDTCAVIYFTVVNCHAPHTRSSDTAQPFSMKQTLKSFCSESLTCSLCAPETNLSVSVSGNKQPRLARLFGKRLLLFLVIHVCSPKGMPRLATSFAG